MSFLVTSCFFVFQLSTNEPIKMDCIYHGCFRTEIDGTNRIIGPNETCLIPSSKLCSKYIEDIPGGVKTRSQYKKQPLDNLIEFDTYFRNK